MITLKDLHQYAASHGFSDNTDVFSILSMMQLDYQGEKPKEAITPKSSASQTEYSIQDVLNLFET